MSGLNKQFSLSLSFTTEEIEEFLIKNGYSVVDYSHIYWHQWGNHDGYGEEREVRHRCAVKGEETPSLENEYQLVFEKLVAKKLKQKILT